jgi:hypothetical protein
LIDKDGSFKRIGHGQKSFLELKGKLIRHIIEAEREADPVDLAVHQ